jgi:hypothetical protein
LESYAEAIHLKGAALNNCGGFIDGTVRLISSPGRFQRLVYNEHKKVHSLKFQSIVAPNGLIANLFGPSFDTNDNTLCIYGDPAYPIRQQIQCPFRGAN